MRKVFERALGGCGLAAAGLRIRYGYITAAPDCRPTGLEQWQRTSRPRHEKTDQGRNTGVSRANVLAIVCGVRKGWLSLWRSVGR